jgi:predicted phage gp36 major capsid-like protein
MSALTGRSVVRSDYAPAFVVGSAGHQNAAAVGDFKQFVVAQIWVCRSRRSRRSLTRPRARPTGQRGFFAYAWAGADVAVPNALRLVNQT